MRRARVRAAASAGAAASLLLCAAPIAAQSYTGGATAAPPVDVESVARPVASATRTAAPIVIDGRLDEAAWQDADSLDVFIQSQPDRGQLATEPTVVRVLFDGDKLYISANCYDSNPDQLTVTTLEQGFDSRESDTFGLTLDTFLDRRNSFMFLINPRGAVRYGQTFDDSRSVDLSWRGVIEVKTTTHAAGWTVELAIPWTTLRFDPTLAEQEWGVNFIRRVRGKNEDSYWAPLDRRDPVHRMSKAGLLTGLGRLPAGRNLYLKPYALAGDARGSVLAGSARGADLDFGGDLKYGVTPKLTLDLTYNTDFSQVEVDQERVNLTRFSLFFPEKRDFFVENSGVFTFGDVTEREYRMGAGLSDFTLFHSRSIGLRNGTPVPIVGGGRLTGRVGGFEVGLLNMQTEGFQGAAAENFTVARARRNVLGFLDVGGMLVNRQATDGATSYNRSYGVDANARLLGDLVVSSYLAATQDPSTEGLGAANIASRLVVAWRDRLWDVSGMHKRVGAGFDPGVGFIRRRGMHHSYATLGAHPRTGVALIPEINPYVEFDYITNPQSVLESRAALAGFGADFFDGGVLSIEYADRFERLETPFQVSGGAAVPPGEFSFGESALRYQSSLARTFSASVEVGGGGYFDGDRRSVGVGTIWRPNYHLSLETTVDHNSISLPAGDFTADVYGARVKYSHSTLLSGSAFVQYNEALDQMVTNVRVNLIHAPLSDLFLVYTERRGLGDGENGVLERFLTAKVTKLVAF